MCGVGGRRLIARLPCFPCLPCLRLESCDREECLLLFPRLLCSRRRSSQERQSCRQRSDSERLGTVVHLQPPHTHGPGRVRTLPSTERDAMATNLSGRVRGSSGPEVRAERSPSTILKARISIPNDDDEDGDSSRTRRSRSAVTAIIIGCLFPSLLCFLTCLFSRPSEEGSKDFAAGLTCRKVEADTETGKKNNAPDA